MLRLQFERVQRRLSQDTLGVLARLPQPTVALIERGRYVPSDSELQRLAVALRVYPPSSLLLEVSVRDLAMTECVDLVAGVR